MIERVRLHSLSSVLMLMVVTIGLSLSSCYKNPGCTEVEASNYDPEAEEDDGSCIYNCDECMPTIYQQGSDGVNTTVTVTDQGEGTGSILWTSDRIWILNGPVYVNNGQELYIEPGTVIKGSVGTGAEAGALIVSRGAKIHACGTESEPIIFTAQSDPLDGSIPASTKGLWGGLIVLGEAVLNSLPGESAIAGLSSLEDRNLYGGSNDTDYSGELCYLSIRHGGANIGDGNQIGSLTLAGVGLGTSINHIEVFAGQDDGLDIFGGTARTKYVITSFCGDDGFDYTEGFRGLAQYWVCVQESGTGDFGGEHGGGISPITGLPYTSPLIYNATFIGSGLNNSNQALNFISNAGGQYHNSIFANWSAGLSVERTSDTIDSYEQMVNGRLRLMENIFHEVALPGTSANFNDLATISNPSGLPDVSMEQAFLENHLSSNGNTVVDPGLSYTISTAGGLNLIPTVPISPGNSPLDPWLDNVAYKGAFAVGQANWAHNWTRLHQAGYLN